MTETTSYTAGLYCRLSKEIILLTVKARVLILIRKSDRLCQAQGISIGGIYCDDGITGVTFERPEFEKIDVRCQCR
jgi:hypothetical protein